jgi:hypothetical protein
MYDTSFGWRFVNPKMKELYGTHAMGETAENLVEQFQGQQLFGTPYFDGGFTKLLSNDLQLDIYAGFDLSPYVDTRLNTSGLFFGTGVSYRFPLAHYLR